MIGDTVPPVREHACKIPCSEPRISLGNHDASARVDTGKPPASPRPNSKRAVNKLRKLNAAPVATVNTDHHPIRNDSTARGPKRSPSVPPTICSNAYVNANAENTKPIVALLK